MKRGKHVDWIAYHGDNLGVRIETMYVAQRLLRIKIPSRGLAEELLAFARILEKLKVITSFRDVTVRRKIRRKEIRLLGFAQEDVWVCSKIAMQRGCSAFWRA